MPQSLMNKTLDNIVMGVSQQYEEGRKDGQVEELINCVPSITRGILRRNPVREVGELVGTDYDINSFTYAYDTGYAGEQYLIVIPGDLLGTWRVFDMNDTSKNWTGTEDYFKIEATDVAKETFKAITLRDYTFIVNTTVETAASTAINTGDINKLNKYAFYWIKMTTQVVTHQKTDSGSGESGSRLEGYTYNLRHVSTNNYYTVEAAKDTRPGETDPDLITAPKIATKLASYEGSWTNDSNSSFVYSTTEATKWDWEDSNGNLASIGVWQTIQTEEELPARIPPALDGFIVRVTGGSSDEKDDYYLQYTHSDTTWNEVAEPGISVGVDPTTMPHTIIRHNTSGVISFTADVYKLKDGSSGWLDRAAGDLETNPDPTFVGNPLLDIFFYKNRMGFVANNTVFMSQIKEYGNLYIRAMRVILDDGPIDVTVATEGSVTLTDAVATEDTLLLFDKDAQFLLHSNNTPLTPKTAALTAVSHYNYNKKFGAHMFENKVIFSTVSGLYAQMHMMSLNQRDLMNPNVEADSFSQHLPTYINGHINGFTSSTGVGQMFMQNNNVENEITVINVAEIGGQVVQQAFHTWLFGNDIDDLFIIGIHNIQQQLYVVFQIPDGTTHLTTLSLELPGEIDTVEYRDKYMATEEHNYTSALEFSRFYYKGQSVKGTERGRLQIRTLLYTILQDSRYITYLENIRNYSQDTLASQFGPTWIDTDLWVDGMTWHDANANYLRRYIDDERITIMSSAENLKAVFSSSVAEPTKGFELQAVNVEALFYQRSSRVLK